MKLILAPMEGVIDAPMRDLLTRLGGFDLCVTEFLRVTDRLLPPIVFQRLCPELDTAGRTSAGVPVALQLLGGQPAPMADNAARAAELGAPAVDINFGCPAKTVNRHDGGAVLLDEPDRIHAIVAAVREAVPRTVPVTAKIRLGNRDTEHALDNARAVAAAGADGLAVHARTRSEGYRPPAHWHWIARIREAVDLPVVANGEVWTPADYAACRAASGCDDVMLGRGAIARPDLARRLKGLGPTLAWSETARLVADHFDRLRAEARKPAYAVGRTKQWLHHLAGAEPAARLLFDAVKRERDLDAIGARLRAEADMPARSA